MHITAGTYRLNSETIALQEIEARKVAISLPPGAIIVIQHTADDEEFVECECDGKQVSLFKVDLLQRGECIEPGLEASALRPRAHFVWPKRYASGANLVQYCHEQAFLLAKGEPAKPELVLRDVLEWRYTGNIHHPTQKPLIALRPLIAAFSKPGDIVLDPFAGSGATVVAAKQLGRQFVAIELITRYCETARQRLRRY